MATLTATTGGGNWGSASSWNGGAFPTLNDLVILTATAGPLTVTNASAALSINAASYANTLTINSGQTLTVNGTLSSTAYLIWGPNATMSGTGTLSLAGTLSCTFSNRTILPSGVVSIATNAQTKTINDTVTVGTLAQASSGVVNGGTISILNAFTPTVAATTGSSTYVMLSGTWSGAFNVANNLILQGGTINIGNVNYVANTLKYVSGTISIVPGTLLTMAGGSYDTNGVTWGRVTMNNAATLTLLSPMVISATLSAATTTGTTTVNGFSMSALGDIAVTSITTGLVTGTTQILAVGNNNVIRVNTSVTTGRFGCPIDIQGTYSLWGPFLGYSTSTLRISGSLTGCTLSLLTTRPTIQIDSPTTFSQISSNIGATFTGGFGFTTNIFTCSTAGNIISLKSLNTYVINNQLTLQGTLASRIVLRASSASTPAILTLASGASQDVSFVTVTDIDSSGAQTIWCWKPTISNSLNWNSLTSNRQTTVS